MTCPKEETLARITVACDAGSHIHTDDQARCLGYVSPLVYGATHPCECPCHDGGKRNLDEALKRAEGSFEGRGDRSL